MPRIDAMDGDVSDLASMVTSTDDGTNAIWLKVVVAGFKVRTCKLCNGLSTDHTPIHVSLADAVGRACDSEDRLSDQYGGFLPWAKYRLVREDPSPDGKKGAPIARTPDGKVCMICLNVFKALGATYLICLICLICLYARRQGGAQEGTHCLGDIYYAV